MDELLASGFDRSDVNVSSADPTGQTSSTVGEAPPHDESQGHGFSYAFKHFFTTLFGADDSEHAQRYTDVVARGHHVLTLTTESEPEVERAADIIERFGPVDLDERHDLAGPAGSLDAGMLAAGASAGSGLQQSAPLSSQSGAAGSGSLGSDTLGSGSLGSGSLGADTTGSLGVASSNVGTGSLGSMQGTQPGALQGAADENRNFFGTQNINDPVPKDMTYQEPMGANMQGGGSMDSATGGNTLSGTQSSSLDSGLSNPRQTASGGSLSQSGAALQGTRSMQGSDDASLGGTIQASQSMQSGSSASGSLQRDAGLGGSQQRDSAASDLNAGTRPAQRSGMRVFSRDVGSAAGSAFDDDTDFRSDWQSNYASLGGNYDDYAPAYRYGSEARGKYRNSDWSDVENDLRSDWDSRYGKGGPSTWDKFKAAVRRGWDKMTPDTDRDSSWRSDWDRNYSSLGGSYDDYQPAYSYGAEARGRYQGRNWDDVESNLRSDWDTRYGKGGPSTWERFKAAVRHGWDKVTPDMDENDSYYSSHWDSNYASSGDSYKDYEPAYRYGNEMRASDKYRGRNWDDVESDLHSDWDSRDTSGGPSTWEKMKASVRHGWDRMTS
jgi:hypothetical protein